MDIYKRSFFVSYEQEIEFLKKGWVCMIDENKDDELLDDGWLVECDEDIPEPLDIGIWKDCIKPLAADTITDALSFVNTMNEQLSAWCISDKLSKYVYSLKL